MSRSTRGKLRIPPILRQGVNFSLGEGNDIAIDGPYLLVFYTALWPRIMYSLARCPRQRGVCERRDDVRPLRC
jgi:hypothetical protein